MRLKPKKRLGQNFLCDHNIRRKIIAACGIGAADTVVEIGPGRGELTALIAPLAEKLIAVEIDRGLSAGLKESFAAHPNVGIVTADFLKFDLPAHIPGSSRGITIIGNIPYYISTPIIERVFEFKNLVRTAYLTVQKEFALRIIAQPGSKEYGSLSCFVRYHSTPEILFTIPRTCFFPVPKVDSAFLRLEIRQAPLVSAAEEKELFMVMRAAFNKRRKTLRKSLDGIINRGSLDDFFSAHNIDRNIRPEDLSLQDFIALARHRRFRRKEIV